MEKMRVTVYVLAVLGALLEPMLAKTDTLNTTDVFTTAAAGLLDLNTDDKNQSLDVSDVTQVFDRNTTKSESSTISGSRVPPVEEMNMTTLIVYTTTDRMKDVHTTSKETRPVTRNDRTTAKLTPTDSHEEPERSSVYVVVLILVVLGVAVIGIIFFCVKSNRKRFSVDIQAKHEDAQIPLASVEPETHNRPSKGSDMKTVTSFEASATETLETTEKQTASTDAHQQVTESPAKTETTKTPAEKSTNPVVADDVDPTASTKTSVETLNDVLNDNNSNNNTVWDVSVPFIQICLDD